MEYHKIFEDQEQDTFINSGTSFKETLIDGLHRELAFNQLRNNYLKVLREKTNEIVPNSDKELQSLFDIFKNRSNYYGKNDTKNIFKNELAEKYNNSSIKENITYEELAIKIGVYMGLTKSDATISNHTNYFTMLYEFDEIERFVFTYDANKLNEHERELRRKCYPENNVNTNFTEMTTDIFEDENIKEESKDIILHGIKFNLYEFALYQREWRDCNSFNTPLREVYDKVLMDFNDPYNYGNKRYDSTAFYRILKEDFLRSKQNFDVYLAYQKVEELVNKTSNKIFKEHIKVKFKKATYKFK